LRIRANESYALSAERHLDNCWLHLVRLLGGSSLRVLPLERAFAAVTPERFERVRNNNVEIVSFLQERGLVTQDEVTRLPWLSPRDWGRIQARALDQGRLGIPGGRAHGVLARHGEPQRRSVVIVEHRNRRFEDFVRTRGLSCAALGQVLLWSCLGRLAAKSASRVRSEAHMAGDSPPSHATITRRTHKGRDSSGGEILRYLTTNM
jgi:hypothetical protein